MKKYRRGFSQPDQADTESTCHPLRGVLLLLFILTSKTRQTSAATASALIAVPAMFRQDRSVMKNSLKRTELDDDGLWCFGRIGTATKHDCVNCPDTPHTQYTRTRSRTRVRTERERDRGRRGEDCAFDSSVFFRTPEDSGGHGDRNTCVVVVVTVQNNSV